MRHGAHAYCKPEDTKVRSVDVIDVLGQLGNAHVGVMCHGQDAKDSQVPPRIESCAQGSHAFRLPHKEIDWQWQAGKPTGAENRVERGRGGGRAANEAC